MKKNSVIIFVLFIYITAFNVLSQNDNSVITNATIDHNKDKELLSEINVDIDGDGKMDYISIYREPIQDGLEQTMVTNLVFISSKNNFKEIICYNFLPAQRLLPDSISTIEKYNILEIKPIKKGIEVIITKENEPISEYKRVVTFEYQKKNSTLKAVKDGGIGVFGKEEQYIKVKKTAKENITLENWSEWYSNLLCSDKTTLNNRIKFVKNEKEFLKAIDNNTTIVIKANKLDLSLDKVRSLLKNKDDKLVKIGTINPNMGVAYADSAWWIDNVSNMSIIGKSTHLTSTKSTDYILWLNSGRNINIANISVYHDLPIDNNGNGWNVCISNSSDVSITQSKFTGFGGVGLFLYNSDRINISQSSFSGIKNYGLLVRQATNLNFIACDFYENQSQAIKLENAFGEFTGCSFFNNTYFYLILLDANLKKNNIIFRSCKEYNNVIKYENDGYKLGYENYFGLGDFDNVKDLNSGYVVLESN